MVEFKLRTYNRCQQVRQEGGVDYTDFRQRRYRGRSIVFRQLLDVRVLGISAGYSVLWNVQFRIYTG